MIDSNQSSSAAGLTPRYTRNALRVSSGSLLGLGQDGREEMMRPLAGGGGGGLGSLRGEGEAEGPPPPPPPPG